MVNYVSTYRVMVVDKIFNSEYYEIQEGEYLALWGIIDNIPFKRVKLVGFIVNTYLSPDRKYGIINLDDGTGTITIKFFKDALKINELSEGDCVVVFGRVSRYNDEIHIIKEDVIKIENLNYFILHRLEFISEVNFFNEIKNKIYNEIPTNEGERGNLMNKYNLNEIELSLMMGVVNEKEISKDMQTPEVKKEEIKAQVVEYIRSQQGEEGVEYSQIIKDLPYNEEVLEEVIVELLSEGSCYEPRPGKIKLL